MSRWPEDVPELSDGRVGLRAHREGDLPAIVEMCRDPIARRWTDLPDPYPAIRRKPGRARRSGCPRLELLAAAGNIASIEVARQAGFRQVGRERQAELLRDGSCDDLITFDLLASQWRPLHRPGASANG